MFVLIIMIYINALILLLLYNSDWTVWKRVVNLMLIITYNVYLIIAVLFLIES